ncbi:MAG: hypothetical protein ACFFBD_05615 [Candidatus Hodarchaeota archaeon]
MSVKKIIIIVVHAFIGWMICGAIMGIGMQVTSMENTLIIHAVGGPLVFFILSLIYFKKFNYTTPLHTALIFFGFIILMDFFVVALLIEKSFDMFKSPLGTWIPFTLIFLVTYFTGLIVSKK